MQGNMVMNIPAVLVSNGQGHVIAVQHLDLAHTRAVRRERGRQGEKVGAGFPEKCPGDDDYHQQNCRYPFILRSNHNN